MFCHCYCYHVWVSMLMLAFSLLHSCAQVASVWLQTFCLCKCNKTRNLCKKSNLRSSITYFTTVLLSSLLITYPKTMEESKNNWALNSGDYSVWFIQLLISHTVWNRGRWCVLEIFTLQMTDMPDLHRIKAETISGIIINPWISPGIILSLILRLMHELERECCVSMSCSSINQDRLHLMAAASWDPDH